MSEDLHEHGDELIPEGDAAEAAEAFGDDPPGDSEPAKGGGRPEGPVPEVAADGALQEEEELPPDDLYLEPVEGPFGKGLESEAPSMAPTPSRRLAETPRRPSGPRFPDEADTAPDPGERGEDGWGTSTAFESVERVQVRRGEGGPGLEVVPAQRALEQGLRFLAIGSAPSQHFQREGLGAELLQSMGGKLQGMSPGGATRRDPHDAAKRTPEVAVDPPTIVAKKPILPPRFSLDEVDDLLPPMPPASAAPSARVRPPALLAPAPSDGRGPSLAPEAASEFVDAGAIDSSNPDPGGSVPGVDGPESHAKLRFHPNHQPLAAAAGRVSVPSGEPGAPMATPGRRVPGGASTAPQAAPGGYGIAHLLGAALLASVLTGAVVRSGGRSSATEDPMAAYALGEREQGLAYLDRLIAQMERELAGKETAMQEAVRVLGAQPTQDQVNTLETLGRDRNRLTITLEALRRRRERLMDGGVHG